jgi:predicted RND superfamily exporter protein
VFPIIVIFGWLGGIGKPVDVGIMLTASVALGIAVDDTLHFLTWFGRGMKSGLSRVAAVRFAFEKCAAAMTQTTCICGIGLLPVTVSQFLPTREFALFLPAILLIALIGDLLLLPAMLVSPLGSLFVRGPSGPGPVEAEEAETTLRETS